MGIGAVFMVAVGKCQSNSGIIASPCRRSDRPCRRQRASFSSATPAIGPASANATTTSDAAATIESGLEVGSAANFTEGTKRRQAGAASIIGTPVHSTANSTDGTKRRQAGAASIIGRPVPQGTAG